MSFLVEQHHHERHKIWGQAGNEGQHRLIQNLEDGDKNTKLVHEGQCQQKKFYALTDEEETPLIVLWKGVAEIPHGRVVF